MRVVVITGSTRGIGYGLADSFLALECAVVVNGRTQGSVDRAVESLSTKHEATRILGQPGDVTQLEQVQQLWDAARQHFGRIDIWINNAGLAHRPMNFRELSPE